MTVTDLVAHPDPGTVALVVVLVVVGVVALKGLAWLLFGDWLCALLTTSLVAAALLSGMVPTADAWDWVHAQVGAGAAVAPTP